MEEGWVPYLLAFGLGTELDRWCVAAPARERTPSMSASSGTEWKTTANRSGRDPGPTFHPGGSASGGGSGGGW